MDLFDWAKSERLKSHGMAEAAHTRAHMLMQARDIAVQIASRRASREITVDDVFREMTYRGIDIKQIGNAAGSIFKGEPWEFTGKYRPSVRISNHGRVVKIWRLRSPS